MGINKYKNIKVNQSDYKKYLGGGNKYWDKRGEFQLALMSFLGLKKKHLFADIGCGPLRAGEYFIKYLNKKRYFGFDSNIEFISIAKLLVSNDLILTSKNPIIQYNEDFTINLNNFDYILLFSVLNHCDNLTKNLFFDLLKERKKDLKIFISHARWYENSIYKDIYPIKNIILNNESLPKELDITKWGWKDSKEIFPIIEL